MRFVDKFFSKVERYSLGTDMDTGKKYLSISVFNGVVEYEEYYEIDPEVFQEFLSKPDLAKEHAERCRRREQDEKLIVPPGKKRGTPC